jgi:two-component system, cell cycle sensor histidine kinase and response regulator CckA
MKISLPRVAALPARILIVEDEGLIAAHISDLLVGCGYEVAGIAESYQDALKQVAECCPDLILMDIHIKGKKDGVETAAALHESFDIPLVFLTAHNDLETVNRAKTTSPFGFLTKPIDQRSLAIAVELAIQRHSDYRAIRHQQSWMATVLATMADAMVIIDSDRKIQFLNGPAEALTGWTNQEARHMEITAVLPLRNRISELHVNELLFPPAQPRPPYDLPPDLVSRRRSGEEFSIEGAVSPSVDAGAVVGAVITFRDATSRQTLDCEIRHRDKMQAVGNLAAGISHDFNNLLFVILGYTEELLATTVDETGLLSLSAIKKAGTTAVTITQQLLNFSRKDAAEKQEVDLNRVVREVEQLLRRLGGPSVTLQTWLDRSLGTVEADPEQLKQVLMNLVANGRDAISGCGSVTVETKNVDVPPANSVLGEWERYIELSVTDTGAGISPKAAQHVFEPFFTTKPLGRGTGLGLSIVHSIVTDHSGTIHVESTPGTGSTFTIYFPRTGHRRKAA